MTGPTPCVQLTDSKRSVQIATPWEGLVRRQWGLDALALPCALIC